jgi:hypothetical protein
VNIFFEFLLRLAGGMSVAMAITSSRHVSSGFFRNHLYVVLGVLTLACLAATSLEPVLLWSVVALACLAYVGAVAWLYEVKRLGKLVLWLLAAGSLAAAYQGSVSALSRVNDGPLAVVLDFVDVATASWLLGMVMMSMLLGHWYLNAPEMEIWPLARLLKLTYGGLVARALLCGGVLLGEQGTVAAMSATVTWLLVLRWLCGFVGLAGVLWMAWQTLKIPNTQSATGLLYVGVFAVLAGEIVSLLLSAQYAFVL